MAQKIIIQTTDDIDGSKDAQTHSFGIDGATYEIDLSDENAALLREALEPFVNSARRISNSRRARPSSNIRQKDVRRWAMENNLPVNPRGRISGAVLEQYEAAH